MCFKEGKEDLRFLLLFIQGIGSVAFELLFERAKRALRNKPSD